MLDNALDCLGPQLEDKLNASTSSPNEPCIEQENVEPNLQQPNDFLSDPQIKEKRGSIKKPKAKENLDQQVTEGEVENDGSNKEANVELGEYAVIDSFTQLLTSPTCGNDNHYDGDLF